jgi:hypothetical protein
MPSGSSREKRKAKHTVRCAAKPAEKSPTALSRGIISVDHEMFFGRKEGELFPQRLLAINRFTIAAMFGLKAPLMSLLGWLWRLPC